MTNTMTDEEAKNIYAHFGLAYYQASCLEHGIVNILCCLKVLPTFSQYKEQKRWENLVDQHYETLFEKTLGLLKKQLAEHSTDFKELEQIMPEMDKCLKERNFLAHDFYRFYAAYWFSEQGRSKIIERLESARDLFISVDEKLETIYKTLTAKLEITREKLEAISAKMLSDLESDFINNKI